MINKYKEYKERQEAKKYLRANNDQFFNSSQWGKVIAIGIISAIICGIIFGVVLYSTRISSSLFYILAGYCIATVLTRSLNVHSQQIAIVSVVMTFLCFIVRNMTLTYLQIVLVGSSISLSSIGIVFLLSIQSLLSFDIFSYVFIFVGLAVAYKVSK